MGSTVKKGNAKDNVEIDKLFEYDIFFSKIKNKPLKNLKGNHLEEPEFLRKKESEEERKEVAQKLKKLIRIGYSLTEISHILVNNDYELLDGMIEHNQQFMKKARTFYPEFGKFMSRKISREDYKAYTHQSKMAEIISDYMRDGEFLNSKDKLVFQDAVSSVVDTKEFTQACRTEKQFMYNEVSTLLTIIREAQKDVNLEDLIREASELRGELKYKKQSLLEIEKMMDGKSKE